VIAPSAQIHSGQFGSQTGLLPRTTANCMYVSGSGGSFFFAASAAAEAKKQSSINSAGINQTRNCIDPACGLCSNEFASAQFY
jgi:4-diphosphocytidyl-2C-methyl-D-erythritol kinase